MTNVLLQLGNIFESVTKAPQLNKKFSFIVGGCGTEQ